MVILGAMLAMLFSVFDQINKAWLQGANRIETSTTARAALDYMSRELALAMAAPATANTPNIYFYGDAGHVNFVAPVNSNPQNLSDLCEVGYGFELVDPANPKNLTMKITRHYIEPSTIANATLPYTTLRWWSAFGTPPPVGADEMADLATNCVVNLQFQYYDQNGHLIAVPPSYQNNKLPYSIVISMGVVDSRTATKLALVPAVATGGTTWQSITNSTLRTFSRTIYLSNVTP